MIINFLPWLKLIPLLAVSLSQCWREMREPVCSMLLMDCKVRAFVPVGCVTYSSP